MQGRLLTRTSLVIQRGPLTLSARGYQHSYRPNPRFGPNQSRDFGFGLSDLSSSREHSHRGASCRSVNYASTFLCSLRSGPITGFHRYYGHSDSSEAGSSVSLHMNSVSLSPEVSLIHAQSLRDHSVSNHPTWLGHRFDTLPFSVTAFRARRSRLRHWLAGSPHTPGRIEFVILRTDRSPPAAPHPASRRRSCSRLQAGERLPEEDFHLSDSVRFQAH